MAKKKNKKKKGTVQVMRYVKVTKKVKAKPSKPQGSGTNAINIGSFAGIKFHVTLKEDGTLDILTMSGVTQEISSNWTDHNVFGEKYPKSEFIGLNNRIFSMNIVLDRKFGQDPHSQLEKLHSFCEAGKVDELNIGSYKIGQKWKIDTISEAWDLIYHEGQLIRATVSLQLSSYT